MYEELQRRTRKELLNQGKKLEEEFRKKLLSLEKEIIHRLVKQPKTEFEAWNLLQVWKAIEETYSDWKKEFLKSVEEHTKETFEKGSRQALEVLKKTLGEEELKLPSWHLIPEESLKFVLKYPLHFAGKFTEDLKEQIREKLFLGIALGKSYHDIARELDLLNLPTIKPFKSSWDRAKTIARTETARAYHMGTLITYEKLGVEEIKIVCGSSPCNLCLSHCGTVKPISYADSVLKHPNCTCTYVAVKRKGKILDKKAYEEGKKLTRIKEYTLEKGRRFLGKFYEEFKDPLPPEEAIRRFKSFFVSEKDFNKHLYKHGIPESVKLEIASSFNIDPAKEWFRIINLIPEDQLKRFTMEYLKKTMRALAHPSRTFYELPNVRGAKPVITIYSGYREWFCVSLAGEEILSSYKLNRQKYKSINDWKKEKEELRDKRGIIKLFEEVGIDEGIREIARRIRNILRYFEG